MHTAPPHPHPLTVPPPASERRSAFSRADLLAVVSMLLLLAGLFVSARANTGRKSSMVECKSNLRQSGAAIDAYRADHSDLLPGPIWAGVFYSYQAGDSGSMAIFLATYLGYPAPDGTRRTVHQLNCPASDEAKPAITPLPPLSVHIAFISQTRITNAPGVFLTYPFGRPNSPEVQPSKHSAIFRPSETWALMDVDRTWLQDMGMSGTSYYNYVPQLPVHNIRPGGPAAEVNRNALFFDGSVQTIGSAR